MSTLVFFPQEILHKLKLALHTELSELKQFNWTISEAYSLPVGLRKFHIKRIQHRLEKEAEEIKKAQRK